jgi:hypothetical protein
MTSRFLYCREKAGDAAAMEINWRAFHENGDLQPPSETYVVAQHYANMNNNCLGRQDIWPRIRSIRVNADNNKIYVSVEANLSMIPSIVPR